MCDDGNMYSSIFVASFEIKISSSSFGSFVSISSGDFKGRGVPKGVSVESSIKRDGVDLESFFLAGRFGDDGGGNFFRLRKTRSIKGTFVSRTSFPCVL